MLLWELCTTEKPFEGYGIQQHMQLVVVGGERPKMDHNHIGHWPLELQWLVNRCWSESPAIRPSFTVIKQTLYDILYKIPDKNMSTSSSTHQNNLIGRNRRHKRPSAGEPRDISEHSGTDCPHRSSTPPSSPFPSLKWKMKRSKNRAKSLSPKTLTGKPLIKASEGKILPVLL